MALLKFSRQEFQALVRKLSQQQPYFSPKERVLLLAIFAAAADRARPSGPEGGVTLPVDEGWFQAPGVAVGTEQQATIADLQQQLLNAYLPGNSFDSVIQGGLTGSITEIPPKGQLAGGSQPASEAAGGSQPASEAAGGSQPASEAAGGAQPKSKKG
jgi:hypothetical protein